MAYARWSDEGCNWYIWWDCGGYLACHYIHDKWANYNYVASRKLRGRGITIKTYTHSKINNDWRYFGKSKANIEDLFKTENEE